MPVCFKKVCAFRQKRREKKNKHFEVDKIDSCIFMIKKKKSQLCLPWVIIMARVSLHVKFFADSVSFECFFFFRDLFSGFSSHT